MASQASLWPSACFADDVLPMREMFMDMPHGAIRYVNHMVAKLFAF